MSHNVKCSQPAASSDTLRVKMSVSFVHLAASSSSAFLFQSLAFSAPPGIFLSIFVDTHISQLWVTSAAVTS